MKKLFTLFALLMVFLGASAEVVVDKEVKFSTFEDGPITGKLTAWSNGDMLSFQDGYLHFHSEAALTNGWDVQFFPLSNLTVDTDVTYNVELKIKGNNPGPIFNMKFGGVDKYGVFNITGGDEWQTVVIEYKPTSTDGSILFQCGQYVGDWDMEYIKVTHEEEAPQNPITWESILTNGDAEGEYGEVACVQSIVWDPAEKAHSEIFNSLIEAEGENKVFVTHAKEVSPTLKFDVETEQWGTTYPAGADKPDNAWQNQMFIVFPRVIKAGEEYMLSFKYKASRNVKTQTQTHNKPGDYLNSCDLGDIAFTTEWQTIEKKLVSKGEQSIAFNLGSEVYTEDIDFYLDDINLQTMKLENGWFITAQNKDKGIAFDYDNATQFTYDEENEAWAATVGTVGNEESWVNEVMISTVRGYSKAFQANTIKVSGKVLNDPEEWTDYTEASKAIIKLPSAGVWTIMVDDANKQINFVKLEGEAEKEPVEVVANPTEIVVNAVERDWLGDKDGQPQEGEEGIGAGNHWDNQFCLMANRKLEGGEVVKISFKYKATKAAKAGTQDGEFNNPGGYVHWNALGDIEFTEEWQEFAKTITIPAEANGMGSYTFNLAIMKGANDYYFKDFIWCNEAEDESLIDMTGTKSFFVKIGAGTSPFEYGTDTAIQNATSNKVATNAIYNLAGQRVSNGYKGIIIKNGVKVIK